MNWFEIVGVGLALLSASLLLGITGLVIWSAERDLARPIGDRRQGSPVTFGGEKTRRNRFKRKLVGAVENVKVGIALVVLMIVLLGIAVGAVTFVLWFVFDIDVIG